MGHTGTKRSCIGQTATAKTGVGRDTQSDRKNTGFEKRKLGLAGIDFVIGQYGNKAFVYRPNWQSRKLGLAEALKIELAEALNTYFGLVSQ